MKTATLCLTVLVLIMCCNVPAVIPAQPGYIKGIVKYATNRPVRSVWVVANQNGAEKGRSLTTDDGSYYISGLIDGTYDLAVMRGNRVVYRRQVQLPANRTFEVVIAP